MAGKNIAKCMMILGLILAQAPLAQAAKSRGTIIESKQEDGTVALSWKSSNGIQVGIETPKLFTAAGRTRTDMPMKLDSHSTEDEKAILNYSVTLPGNYSKVTCTYQVECQLQENAKKDLLICETKLRFSEPVKMTFSTDQRFSMHGKPVKTLTIPERLGIVRTHDINGAPEAYFDIGRAVGRDDTQLALPAIGVNFKKYSLGIAADPYIGTEFIPSMIGEGKEEYTQLSLVSRYYGSLVPVQSEDKTTTLEFHREGIDGTLNNFYNAIPDIKSGPDWIHDIQLTFYEYISDTGATFKTDLDELAKRIPEEYRKHVLVCVHGYYDYLGRYSYNHKTKTFDDEWDAYDNDKKHLPMTKEKLHDLLRLVKSYGFRCAIYYSDALAYDGLNPDLNKDWLLMDETGKPARWWYWQRRPDKHDKEENYVMDPSNPEVQEWFMDYTKAYMREFGKDLDAMIWDETHCIKQGQLAKTPRGMVHIDRELMKLVAEVTREVQNGWSTNPDFALLLSDNVMMHGAKHIPFCLVSHGTWQDSTCNPKAWAPGMIPNFRNCLMSCNWFPVRNRSFNRIAVEDFGLPQGLTNGWGDNLGPSEMPEEVISEVIDNFLKRCKSGKDRTRYLLPRTPFYDQ